MNKAFDETHELIKYLPITLILIIYLIIGTLYAIKTPAWQVPDEPAHYNYVRQVATTGELPVIRPGDWDNDYLEKIKRERFSLAALGDRLGTIQYEDHQPPLYYVLEAPIYNATQGNLTAMRLLSVLFGAGVVIAAWGVVTAIFPAQAWLAAGTAGFVAFLPQHVAMMAGVENDALGELLVGIILFACAVYLGLCILTKLTAMLPMMIVIPITILLHSRRERWSLARLLREAAWVAIPALILGVPFWLRNISVYGGTDFLAQAAHDSIVIGQQRTSDYIATHGVGGWLRDGLRTTFQSFWGQFGWMGVPLNAGMYLVLFLLMVIATIGAITALIRGWQRLTIPQRDGLIILGLTALLAVVEHIGYNLKFVQFQGRYLYAGLIPVALFMTAGLAQWVSILLPQIQTARWAVVGVISLLAAFDLYILFRIIIPALS
jgi:4-amino-4-deoxy-L-arabinose transferase-like glycosyltransferase